MDIFQLKESPKTYDVLIVGSGAGGGMAAHELAKAGAKICILEAGQDFDPADPKYITQLKWPWQSPRRGASTKYRPFGDFDAAYGGWDIEGEPYGQVDGTDFRWFRSRMTGGRTNHWGRISLRFGPQDFKKKSIDGLGEDWPIGYEDVAPYYDKVDRLIGVFGSNEGLPNDPDSIFLPPPKLRVHELFIKKGNKNLGITTIPSRLSILTKPINDERGACFYCHQCNRGCMAYADFSSSSCLVKPAKKTGNTDLINHAMVREVLTDAKTGLATGVSYIDTLTFEEKTVRASVVILAASACESARCSVMLRTASPWSTSTSRSGSVPVTPPQSAAFQTAVRRPMTATPTAAPSANWETESTGAEPTAAAQAGNAEGSWPLPCPAACAIRGPGHRRYHRPNAFRRPPWT